MWGDLTDGSRLGLARESYDALTRDVTEILHCAASTQFDLPLDQARVVNVEGTRNMIAFARECRRVQRIGCCSTVYVAGKRTGEFTEDDLDNGGAGFVNTYEQSKYEAEQMLRAVMAELPLAMYRLSTLIGDSQSGRVNGFNAVHHAASRGDNALIRYLVSKGTDPTAVGRRGQTTADLANGPVQRVQPFPDTIALLVSLGAKNNNRCVSC